ncbi:hypothetical protein AB0O47_32600 [Streptomyces noursei]|uniref:hypothetical protein n=1 Tax=Streptomyces noursei TaxID=1971 RepID=UPI00344E0CA4
MPCRNAIDFIPAIIPNDAPPPENIDPARVRIAFASKLTDGDLVVGIADTITFASVQAHCQGLNTPSVSVARFYNRPYPVSGHTLDAAGWVSLANDCFVWRQEERVLYVPAASH